MQEPQNEITQLGQAWIALADSAGCQEGCLKDDEIWDGVRGKLPVAQTRHMVDHLARCPACAESWQLARLLSEDTDASSPFRLRSALAGWPRWAAAVAAMILLGALGMQRWASQLTTQPPFRQASQITIDSLLSEGSPLPRDEFVLEWTPVASNSKVSYQLTLTSRSLDIVFQASNLEEARYHVPPERLSKLPSGTLLQWQVMATTEDGGQFKSRTFLTRLQ